MKKYELDCSNLNCTLVTVALCDSDISEHNLCDAHCLVYTGNADDVCDIERDLKAAMRDFLRSEEGQSAVEENCQCFTMRDFFNTLNDDALRSHGFYDVMCTRMSNLDIAVHYVLELCENEDLTSKAG